MENTCPICISTIENKFTTSCGHDFCKKCMMFYCEFTDNVVCPMCRQPLLIDEKELYKLKIPFDSNNFPENPDIKEKMVLAAYNTVSKLEKWRLMYDFKVKKDTGFMFCQDPEMNKLMDKINVDYNENHSGFSMGYTMRQLQYIAYYGLDLYLKIKK
jgi:hypothetical protein